VTNQIFSPYSMASLKELKMNLNSKSRRLEVTMVSNSIILESEIIVMKKESNMNFQLNILWTKMELLKERIRL
jgi:hypothetical protein